MRVTRLGFILGLFCAALPAFAQPAALPPAAWPSSLTSEQDVADAADKIRPFYEAGVQGTLTSWDGLTLHYIKYELADERAAVAIVPGRGESKLKYTELAQTLVAEGYSVYILDLRGQGESDRQVANPQMVHVNRFQDYLTDVQQFTRQVVKAVPHRRVFGLAHSMGGLVALQASTEGIQLFDALVLSSPFLDARLEPAVFGTKIPLSHWEAYRLLSVMIHVGSGWTGYALTQKDPAPINLALGQDGFDGDHMTHSQVRYTAKLKSYLDAANGVRTGGSSNGWLWEVLHSMDQLPANLPHMGVRTLLLEAGQDYLGIPAAEDQACAEMPHCSLVKFPGAYHEIFQEADNIRAPAVLRTLAHFINPYRDASAEGLRPDELSFQLGQLDWLLAHHMHAEAVYAAERLNWLYLKFKDTVPGWSSPDVADRVGAAFARVQGETADMTAGEAQLLAYFRTL